MAYSGYTSASNETVKAWSEQLYRETRKAAYFEKFMGGADAIVQEDTFLSKNKGDQVRFTMIPRLTGSGVEEGAQLEGNEEKLTTYTSDVTLKQLRHAVMDDGALSRQRVQFELPDTLKESLKIWGSEQIDNKCFEALGLTSGSSVSPTRVYNTSSGSSFTKSASWNAAASSVNNSANGILTLDFISKLKKVAQVGLSDRSYNPVRPVKYKGRDLYVILVHPYALADLRASSAFQTAQREAQERSAEHPLFTGAEAFWDGVVIHAHENVQYGTINSIANCSKGVFLGAQALTWAWGQRQKMIFGKRDWENQEGVAWGMIYGVKSPLFNSKEFGVIHCLFNATNLG